MIPALPCGTFADSATPPGAFYIAAFEANDTPHRVGEYRIDVAIQALQALKACGYDDVEVGSIERGDRVHLLLIGLDGEARFGDISPGCVAVAPVGVQE